MPFRRTGHDLPEAFFVIGYFPMGWVVKPPIAAPNELQLVAFG